MSKPAAATASSCQLHIGGFCAVLATAILLPSVTFAANPDPTLRRSDQVDVRRLGKVSEDERSVLRIEWRAGLAGVEETRSVQDMLDKLRRLESSISEVNRLIRNMPVQNPVVAAAVPVVTVVPAAAQVPATDGFDVRLMVANLAALALVTLWWFRRRKPVTRPETGPASAPENAPPDAASPPATPPVAGTLATAALAGTPPAETPPNVSSAATQLPIAVTPTKPADDAPRSAPGAAGTAPAAAPDPGPGPGPVKSAEPVATASFNPPDSKPSEAIAANEAMMIDFSLEEADPEVVARENARLLVPRAVSAPKPPQTPQETNVEPTLQLAEIMLSMGLEQGAAQTLIEYIEANPRHAVYHWLKLLGIYHSRGLQKEFVETAEKLRTHFNIQAEEWGKPAEAEAPALENFSRVSEHVQKTWAQPEECITYLRHLLEDNREGARAGFPQAVAEEILFLVEILKDGQA
jgi:hypothetical protein